MAPKDKSDFQTLNLFVILALLTVLFVSGLRLVLFAPTLSQTQGGSELSVEFKSEQEARK